MNKMMLAAALFAAVGFGCKKKNKEEGTGGGMAGSSMGSGSAAMAGSGSAAMAGSGSAAAAPKPMTPEEVSKRFEQCWGYVNDGKLDDFKGCFAADSVQETVGTGMPPNTGPDAIAANVKNFKDAFPDLKGEQVLEIVSGHNVAAFSFVSGTNNGPMKTPMGEMPPTKAKTGVMMGQVAEIGDDGKAKHIWDFEDMGELMGQLKPDPKHPTRPAMDKAPMAKMVLISKDDAGEKANIETAKKVAEAFSKHDAKAFGDLLADDVKWSESSMPKDSDKKATVANAQAFWKAFSDAKITPDKLFAAGDYVIATGAMDATNDGDFKEMGLKKTGKHINQPHIVAFMIKDGKVHNAWLIENSMGMAMQLGLMPPPGAAPAGDKGSGAGSAAPADKKPADKKPAGDKKPADKKG